MSKPTVTELARWVEANLSDEPLDELGGFSPRSLIAFDLNSLAVLFDEENKRRASYPPQEQ